MRISFPFLTTEEGWPCILVSCCVGITTNSTRSDPFRMINYMVIQHPGKIVVVVFYYILLSLQRIKPTLASLSKEGDLWGKCVCGVEWGGVHKTGSWRARPQKLKSRSCMSSSVLLSACTSGFVFSLQQPRFHYVLMHVTTYFSSFFSSRWLKSDLNTDFHIPE